MLPPGGAAAPKVTLCVAPVMFHVTVPPGAIVTLCGLNEDPGVETVAVEPLDGGGDSPPGGGVSWPGGGAVPAATTIVPAMPSSACSAHSYE
jgi:hypothetical protein